MAGLVSGLEDILGINTTAGTGQLQQALQALQAVNVPNIAQLTLPQLQQYVRAGVLTPQQYQAISADPQAFQTIANQADQTGIQAQKAALTQLGGIAQTGSTPIMQAQLINAINTANQNERANRGAIEQNAQERGVAGGGQEFLNKILGEQGAATTANAGALQAGANNAQLALQALAGQGALGGNVQAESNAQTSAKAQAAQQIAEYNSQLQSAANQYNTQMANEAQAANLGTAQRIGEQNTNLANQRTMYNAALPAEEYGMQMQKAGGLANIYGQQANLAENQAAQNNAFIGNLIGAGATMGGDYLAGKAFGSAMNAGNAAKTTNNPYSGTTNPATQIPGNQYQPPNLNLYPPGQPYNYAEGGEVESDEDTFNKALRLMESGKYSHPEEHSVPGPENRLEIYKGKDDKQHAAQVRTAAHGGMMYNQGGMCYAQGGEVHDHEICMKLGGTVPGEPKVPGDSTQNDTIPAKLSPHEIVLPRSVSMAPNAPQKAAQFVGGIKGQPLGPNFADVIKMLEANGLELRLGAI